MRADLLALSDADLEMLSNRGTVKRARREIDNAETPFTLSIGENESVTLVWSDEQVTTQLPPDKILKNCPCTCPMVGICRHIIKGVIAYQQEMRSGSASSKAISPVKPASHSDVQPATSAPGTPDIPAPVTPDMPAPVTAETSAEITPAGTAAVPSEVFADLPAPPPPAPPLPPALDLVLPSTWDPGEIPDDSIKKLVSARTWSRAQDLLASGQIVELARGPKPFAKFHTLSHSLRFAVPHDLRYARCDCAEAQPCVHAVMSVLAFRLLSPDKEAGIVNTTASTEFHDDDLVAEVEDALHTLYLNGIANALPVAVPKLKRVIEKCRERIFHWPAEILNEVVIEITRYHQRDSRFSASNVASLIAECVVRLDAIKSNTGAAPIEFIRGFNSDKATAVTSSRLVALGCGASITRRGTALTAYIQDVYSGNLLTVNKDFSYKLDDDTAPRLATLGARAGFKDMGLAQLARGQLLIKGGTLSSAREYDPGRAKFSFNHQTFQWENLRPPLSVDSFAQLRSFLKSQLPGYLTSRYSGRSFFVCTVRGAVGAHFDSAEQTVEATLEDAAGETARLSFPYLSACAEGADALLHHLQRGGGAVRFVSGHVHIGRHGLTVQPVAVVFDDGDKRSMVQPWVDSTAGDILKSGNDEATARNQLIPGETNTPIRQRRDPMLSHFADIFAEMGALITAGLQSADAQTAASWRQLSLESESLGFSQVPELIQRFVLALAQKQNRLSWQPTEAVQGAINVTILALIAREEALQNAD